MTINETLDNLERLAKGATPGPWMEIETESSVTYPPSDLADDEELSGWSDIAGSDGLPFAVMLDFGNEDRLNANITYALATQPATILLLTTAIREMEARLKAVEPLVEACVADFTNAATEAHPDAMGYPDADLVAFGVDTKLTFGMIRSARLALSTNGGKG